MVKRGYYGIGIYGSKFETNLGTLWRHALLYDANFIFTIGKRYKREPTNTSKAERHIPLYHYADWVDFMNHLPADCHVALIEQTMSTVPLNRFPHPERCAYVLGAEDGGIPNDILEAVSTVIEIPGALDVSMNVATAGTLVMYDRYVKSNEGNDW
jgi:tRNA G18 (ribose-2'-O)-methylase SpoU